MGFAVGENNDGDGFSKAVDDGESFCFACRSHALPLKIHSVAGAGFIGAVSREHSVS